MKLSACITSLRGVLFVGGLAIASVAMLPAADLIVNGTGSLIVRGNATVNGGDLTVKSGGIANLDTPGVLNADTAQVQSGGFLFGCGTLNATLDNDGTVEADCGSAVTFTIAGTVTNDGKFRVLSNTTLNTTGIFTNNGFLSLFNAAPGSLPSNFVDNGNLGLPANARIKTVSIGGSDFTLTIDSASGFIYQAVASTTLQQGSWLEVGTPQVGTGSTLTFLLSGEAVDRANFFRFDILECE
ncbi:MAG: hypothetical protein AAF591_19390 [Verrucomicrobiota bacterium]